MGNSFFGRWRGWFWRGCSACGRHSVTAFAGEAPVCGAALKVADKPRIVVGGVGRKPGRWPTRGGCGAAAWARRTGIQWLVFQLVLIGRWGNGEERACAGGACRSVEQAVMAGAVEAARQQVEQEAADELVGGERHDLLAVGAVAAIILVAEGDAGWPDGEQPLVGDGDAVGVAREIGEHRLGAGEGWLGVDHPAFAANRREVAQEGAPISQPC